MDVTNVLAAEHRLIGKMVALMERELGSEKLQHTATSTFIYSAVDFFENYADRTHHGKEEGILFKGLSGKKLTPRHKDVMAGLVREHETVRKETAALGEAARMYERGDLDALARISTHLKRIVAIYPAHMEKEEKKFFPAAMKYLSPDEKKLMLDEFFGFDAGMAHEKYMKMVEKYEA